MAAKNTGGITGKTPKKIFSDTRVLYKLLKLLYDQFWPYKSCINSYWNWACVLRG